MRQRVREVLDDWASRVFEPDSPRRALPQNPWSRALRNQWSRGALSSSLFDIDDRPLIATCFALSRLSVTDQSS